MTLTHEVRAGGIVLNEAPEASVVTLWGEIDIALRDEASAALAGAFQRDLPVVVDASEVTFLDSAGIAFLVQLCRIGQDEGLSVTLHDPPSVVSRALGTLHLHVPVAG
ncbi:STAS domain-containing protein [Isoptericola haloaureus]|uniref:STAS domain-containing protein n=1 Tax=Isoptericola haloaureus TaxID=1542902 RepID=A0ABU7ZAL1_9MICO